LGRRRSHIEPATETSSKQLLAHKLEKSGQMIAESRRSPRRVARLQIGSVLGRRRRSAGRDVRAAQPADLNRPFIAPLTATGAGQPSHLSASTRCMDMESRGATISTTSLWAAHDPT